MSPEPWMQSLEDAFVRAAAAEGEQVAWFSIAGLAVRLRSAGPAPLSRVTRTLEHLRASPPVGAAASLTVLLFDAASAAGFVPAPPAATDRFTARGDILGFNTARWKAAYQPFGRIVSAFDVERSLGICCFGAGDGVLAFERAAPLRSMLSWWLRLHGRQVLHAAVVGRPEAGLLLAGKGGSGKSNTAMACLEAGLCFAGDDVCAVGVDPADAGARSVAWSLYATARTLPGDQRRLAFLGDLAEKAADPGCDDKALYYLLPRFADRVVERLPVNAILLPRVGGGTISRLRPATAASALLAIAPVTTTLLPDAGPEVFAAASALVKSAPVFDLELGRDIAGLRGLLVGLLDELGAAGAPPSP